ncbi:MAG TPA: amino acid adenylation domain-containing protein [Acetobacteraceae bacterium]|nr:amino acid adenylation domain-containing protein [Acetobacteraceae bacterium]
MSEVQHRQLLAAHEVLPPTPAPWGAATLAELVLRSAARHGNRTALWVDGCSVSYSELVALASQIACSLAGSGLGPGNARCGILANRSLTAFAGILGALLAGSAYVPLNPAHPTERLSSVLKSADVDALIVDGSAAESAADLLSTSQPLRVLLPQATSVPDWAVRAPQHRYFCRGDLEGSEPISRAPGSPDDGAYLLHTSGSTGVPKGILVRHRNVIAYLRNVAARYAPTPQDRFSQFFDLTFDLSVHDIFLCWGAGATLYCPPPRVRFAPREFARRHALTMWFSVPSTAAMMMGLRMLRPGDLPTLRFSLFCGEVLPKQIVRAWAAAAPNSAIENLYGPTEATIAITAFRLPKDPAQLAVLPDVTPIGTALPNQDTALFDAADLPADEGELCLAGTQVTDGYWRDAALTDQRFIRFAGDNRIWYRTGDRARLSTEHGLLFLGRLDRQVKIAGYRIELDEIEAILQHIVGTNAAAVAWPIGPEGLARGIVAFIKEVELSDQIILDQCRRLLPAYAVPDVIRRTNQWPVNSNGKTDRARLLAMME